MPPLQSCPGLGHLVLNTHPEGGFIALGISPFNSIAFFLSSGSIDGIDDNEAQRRALEDALYYASSKAGVKVQGYSSINEETTLNENFTVQPNNKILDYKIIKSYKKEGMYTVEIEAIIGNLENARSQRFREVCTSMRSHVVGLVGSFSEQRSLLRKSACEFMNC